MNDVNMFDLCAKSKISQLKTLCEGRGWWVENKFGHPFTGFKGSHQLITCNALACPFVDPENSRSGYTWTQYQLDKKAMLDRCRLVEFNVEFKHMKKVISETDWAQCLLYMAENLTLLPDPEAKKIFQVEVPD